MTKYLRISSYIRKPFLYMTLQLLHSEYPYIWEKLYFLFYQCRAVCNKEGASHCPNAGGLRPNNWLTVLKVANQFLHTGEYCKIRKFTAMNGGLDPRKIWTQKLLANKKNYGKKFSKKYLKLPRYQIKFEYLLLKKILTLLFSIRII